MTLSIDKKTKALLFDCDGTLVDSMPMHRRAWIKTFEAFKLPWTDDFLDCYLGLPSENLLELYIQHFGVSVDTRAFIDARQKNVEQSFDEVKPIPFFVNQVKKWHPRLPLVIASAGHEDDIEKCLKLTEIRGLFKRVFHAENTQFKKPSPEFFLEIVDWLKVKTFECHLIDDNTAALKTALKLGMRVTNALQPNRSAFC